MTTRAGGRDKPLEPYVERSKALAQKLAADGKWWDEVADRLCTPAGDEMTHDEFVRRYLSD